MKSTNKIVVIGVKYDSNLGDFLLGDCLCYLLSREIPCAQIDYIDMRGRNTVDKFENDVMAPSMHLYKRIRHLGGRILRSCFPRRSLKDEAALKAFFEQHLSDASVVVFAGGGIIEYKHYQSDLYIQVITAIAKERHIPVVFNAVGMLDHFNARDKRAQALRGILQNPNVKFIGVRENVSWMETWVDHKKNVQLVCDPACFASGAYDIKKDNTSNLVGIGLIRPDIFRDFNGTFTECETADLYASVVKEFLSQGYQCELFTNGYKGDVSLAELMCSRHPDLLYLKDSVKNPIHAKELVETVSRYKMVFSARMHAAITSYALGIPCVTLCWADKIKAFYENIGHPERCFYTDSVEPSDAIRILVGALVEDDTVEREKYLTTSMMPIEVVKQYCAC